MIGIIDYGMGNLRSVKKALERLDAPAEIISEPEQIAAAEKLILPGVGAFADAMATLRDKQLVEPIQKAVEQGKWFLGICLGLQLLFDVSFEDGEHEGLKIIPGQVRRFAFNGNAAELKVPHMGWNALHFAQPGPLYSGLEDYSYTYFVHSYHVVPDNPAVIATTTDYGYDFVSSIARDNVLATQFHPEKSQRVGMQILQNFAAL